ncbi:MAG: O-methyltransferase [Verrucomicrobiaceae bacterium]
MRRLGYELYLRRHPEEPWLAQGAVRFLDEWLTSKMSGWEWGSGRSSLWFAQRIARLVSIEHDKAWHQKVSQQLAEQSLTHVDLRHLALEHPELETYELDYPTLPQYAAVILYEPDASFDFVLVDGWYRAVCARAALPKLKPGGLLVIDNTDWQHPPQAHVPADWHLVHQSRNVITETSIWRKP